MDGLRNGGKTDVIRRTMPVVIIGLLLSLAGFGGVRWIGKEKLNARFQNTAKTRALLVTNTLGVQRRDVGAMQRFFLGNSHVAPDEFSRFVRPFPRSANEVYRSYNWSPRVTDDMREAYEKENGGQSILARGEDGNLFRAPRKEVYFPVKYSESIQDNVPVIGLDLSWDHSFQAGLESACDAASPAIVPLLPRSAKTDPYVFMMIYPVYEGDFSSVDLRRQNLIGFVSGAFCLNDVMDSILNMMPAGDVKIMIYDVTDSAEGDLLYADPVQDQSALSELAERDGPDAPLFRYSEAFEMADHMWQIICLPSQDFIGEGHFLSAWIALGIGCLLTGLITAQIYYLSKRSRKVESLVRERTEALDESRMRLQLALSGADLGPWDWHIGSGDLVLSERLTEMAGFSLSEFEAKLDIWRKMIHPEDMPRVRRAIRTHLKGDTPGFEAELRIRHKSGRWLWILNRGRVVERDNRGWAIRACGTCLDITQRKQIEQSRELLATAVEQVAESIVITNTEGIVQYVNPAFERITEYSLKEVVGRRDPSFFDRRHNGQDGTGAPETVRSGETWNSVQVAQKKSGALFYENVVVSPVFDSGGNIVNYVCVKHDQTEQRRLEDERMQLEMKFRQAQKMESIGRLTGGVAHDLNNLLGPILGYSELIRDTMTPPGKIRKAVDKIHYAGERARDVVSQLLAFGRKQRLSLSVLDICDVIRHFEPLIRRTLREDIRLEVNNQAMPCWIRVDCGQFEQILMNLVVNAQDAMPRGGRLAIETTEVAATEAFPGAGPAETCVRLVISDTGHGMDEKVLGNLFEPFFTTKGTGEGTGLGLSMVYGTVKQHDGVIRVKSAPGEGASFFIYFPLTMPEAAPLPRTQANAVERGSETVMLVEDDDGIREMIGTILTNRGYRVLSAVAGPDCLGMLDGSGGSVDLLLTDIIMPGMNGRELYAEVAKKYPDMKVIYMSGYSADVLAAHGAVFDGINFIQKPFTIQSVCSKVRQVLDAQDGREPSAFSH